MGLAGCPLALTLGDPAGIGPDITLLAWTARTRETIPPFVLIGDAAVLAERARALGLTVPIGEVSEASAATGLFPQALPVPPVAGLGPVMAGRPEEAPCRRSSSRSSAR
jgi:4-hydroxythreonine-4-phosphate dehydrogenase